MALNLARMGTIQRQPVEDFDPFAEGAARRRAAQLEQQGVLDLAKGRREANAAERQVQEDLKTREVLGQYIQSREGQNSIPLGVAHPSLVKPRQNTLDFGPQPEGVERVSVDRVNPDLERNTTLNLARINPDTAEKFRIGRRDEAWGLEDRTRKIGFEDQDQRLQNDAGALAQRKYETDKEFEARKLTEMERNNRAQNNAAWVQARASMVNAQNKGSGGGKILPSNRVVELADQASGLALLDKVRKGAPKGMSPLTAWFKTRNPFDTEAQTFNQYLATVKQVIGKNLEGGVLRLEDEKKYEKILPKASDTPRVRKIKEAQLADMLVGRQNQQLQSLQAAGYNLDGQEPAQLSEDDQAIMWAIQNQSDPRAAKILDSAIGEE